MDSYHPHWVIVERKKMSAPFPQTLEPRSPGQVRLLEALRKSIFTFAIGPAGTGKTHLPIAHAVEQFRNCKKSGIEKLILCRPTVIGGDSDGIGYLPGDLNEKMDPFVRPLLDELSYFYSPECIRMMFEKREIEIAPLCFIRGRNFNYTFVVCDEAQNATRKELRTLMTRLGPGGRMSICGDVTQCDLPRGSCLKALAIEMSRIDGIRYVELDYGDVQRNKLIQDIDRVFEIMEDRERCSEIAKSVAQALPPEVIQQYESTASESCPRDSDV